MELHYRHFSIEMVNKQEKRKECLLTAETDYAILHDTDKSDTIHITIF